MGKRTSYPRKGRDYYPTPEEAVGPLLSHLDPRTLFDEPCVGGGHLVRYLEAAGHICVSASDLASDQDALNIQSTVADCFITNPPWKWEALHPLITHLSDLAPCWMLLNADLMHNKRMAVFMERCYEVVSVGRCSWMGNKVKGYENAAWYLFDARKLAKLNPWDPIEFHPRQL